MVWYPLYQYEMKCHIQYNCNKLKNNIFFSNCINIKWQIQYNCNKLCNKILFPNDVVVYMILILSSHCQDCDCNQSINQTCNKCSTTNVWEIYIDFLFPHNIMLFWNHARYCWDCCSQFIATNGSYNLTKTCFWKTWLKKSKKISKPNTVMRNHEHIIQMDRENKSIFVSKITLALLPYQNLLWKTKWGKRPNVSTALLKHLWKPSRGKDQIHWYNI